MSDTIDYYKKLYSRAANLADQLDKTILSLMDAEVALQEIAKSDFGEPGEMDSTCQDDLNRCITTAAFHMRLGEQVNHGHMTDLAGQLTNRGVNPSSITIRHDDAESCRTATGGARPL